MVALVVLMELLSLNTRTDVHVSGMVWMSPTQRQRMGSAGFSILLNLRFIIIFFYRCKALVEKSLRLSFYYLSLHPAQPSLAPPALGWPHTVGEPEGIEGRRGNALKIASSLPTSPSALLSRRVIVLALL